MRRRVTVKSNDRPTWYLPVLTINQQTTLTWTYGVEFGGRESSSHNYQIYAECCRWNEQTHGRPADRENAFVVCQQQHVATFNEQTTKLFRCLPRSGWDVDFNTTRCRQQQQQQHKWMRLYTCARRLLTADRFSKFFHWHTPRTICDKIAIRLYIPRLQLKRVATLLCEI